jgi:hypothetical protein
LNVLGAGAQKKVTQEFLKVEKKYAKSSPAVREQKLRDKLSEMGAKYETTAPGQRSK